MLSAYSWPVHAVEGKLLTVTLVGGSPQYGDDLGDKKQSLIDLILRIPPHTEKHVNRRCKGPSPVHYGKQDRKFKFEASAAPPRPGVR